jgi:hypothetical protein
MEPEIVAPAGASIEVPPGADAVETAGDAAVAIADIEAARDVKLAEISADVITETEETRADAAVAIAEADDGELEDELAWVREALDGLAVRLAERLDNLAQAFERLSQAMETWMTQAPQSTPTPPPDPEATPIPEKPEPADAASPVPEPEPSKKPARRWM